MRVACTNLPFSQYPVPPIVTPNRLFADVLAAQYIRDRLATKQSSWERPVITSIYAWLANLWQNARYAGIDVPSLLSPVQERALWQQLFESAHPDLFDFAGAARLAIEAARTIAEWHIPLENEAWDEYKDASHFRQLYREFRRRCEELGCITRSDLWRLAPNWMAREEGRVVLVGFEYSSPALQSLPATHYPLLLESRKRAKRIPAAKHESLEDELETCARWARRLVEDKGTRSVGILLPKLSEHRASVRRIFDSVFYPSGGEDASAVHIHSAESLHSQPLVASALLLLELVESDLDTVDASAILRSPFVAGAEPERNARALADVQLRRNRAPRVTLKDLEFRTAACPLLQSAWQAVRRVLRAQPRVATLAAWGDRMTDLLSAMGWPGDRPLDAGESAVLDSWKDTLTQLTTLSFVFPAVTLAAAKRELRRMLSSSATPVSGDLFSPVQILDANGAAGLTFDAAAAAGFSEGAWPGIEPGQPFIPLRLRRQAGLPGSTPASISEMRARRTQRIFSAAPEMIATYTESPAPLARPFLNLKAAMPEAWTGDRPAQSFPVADLDRLVDEQAPPLRTGQPPLGGVSIIKSQSLCPFQAFARYRLLTNMPEDPCFGLDARERGGTLHKALEHVWRMLETSDALQSTGPDELRTVVSNAVTEAVLDHGGSGFHQLVHEAERNRLTDVLLEWLQLEKMRKVPFRVEHIEEKRTVELAGLPLSLRVDRIDRLPNGSVLLLDYKSGVLSAKDLLGERPREPQLLVYASAVDEEVDGIYLAQVRAREMKAQGMASREHFPEGRKTKGAPSWQVEREEAREKLRTIAEEFLSGRAAVDPQAKACEYCEVKLLCRVAEAGGASGDDFDE